MEETLRYFDEVEDISQLFTRANLSVLDPKFTDALERLDASIGFIAENPSYMEARLYMQKFQQLQTRGLTMVKSYVVTFLKNTVARHASEDFETRSYIKFRAVADSIRPLCKEIEKRVRRREYLSLLGDCHYCYFQQRDLLLRKTVEETIRGYEKLPDLASMIRSGCAYLIRLCQSEYELYRLFFSTFSTAMRSLLEGFGDMLYTALRPLFIRAQDVNLLCSAAHVLKKEILLSIQEKGESVQAFLGVINRMLEDIQERLVFLAQKFIIEEIRTFSPTAKDLNYPERLMNLVGDKEGPLYEHWYTTMEKTLLLLTHLYLSIDVSCHCVGVLWF